MSVAVGEEVTTRDYLGNTRKGEINIRFMGFDISSVSTGVSVVDMAANGELSVVFTTNIITNSKDKTGKRLKIFAEEMTGLLNEFKPDFVIKETTICRNGNQFINMKFFAAFELVLELEGYPKFYEYAPTSIKKTIAGHGRATKEAVAEAIQKYTEIDVTGLTNDETDSLGVVLTHIGKTATLIPKAEITAAREFDERVQEALEEVGDL